MTIGARMFEKHKAEKAQLERQHAASEAAERARTAFDAWQASKLEETLTSVTGAVLKKGEVALGSVDGAGLIEPKQLPGHWAGGSNGVSFRIAKGVSYRVGQSRGTFTPGKDELAVIDMGLFVITNQRCFFTGPKRSTEWAYTKLLGFSLEGSATAIFNVSNRQKASGVLYNTEVEPVVDSLVAAAIASYTGAASHDALVAEMEQAYSEAWNEWNALNTATTALPGLTTH